MYGARCMLTLAVLAMPTAGQEAELRCQHPRCWYNEDNKFWPEYQVDGKKVKILSSVGLTINCFKANVLESTAMPRFSLLQRVSQLFLEFCPLPNSPLAETLAAINVTLQHNLTLYGLSTTLQAKHFSGLEHLNHLNIMGEETAQPRLDHGFLAPLQNLRSLKIRDTIFPAGESFVTPTLESLLLYSWKERQPKPLIRCDSLRVLELVAPKLDALPDGWVRNCSRLEVIDFNFATRLKVLPPKLLLGARALKRLTLTQGALESFPPNLLEYTPDLRKLQLTSNKLVTLGSGTFEVARRVEELDLSSNKLVSRSMVALAPLDRLIELHLSANQRLRNICGTDGFSPIRNSTRLKKLVLSFTSVSQICRDWQEDMTQLHTLDLSFTKVAKLSFKELQFKRTVEANVFLPDACLTAVQLSRADYEAAARGLVSNASLHFYNMPTCDCHMYWTRQALNLSLPALRYVEQQRCPGIRKRLRDMALEELVCSEPAECRAAGLPAACACTVRAADEPDHDSRLVEVRCERAGLDRVPRPRSLNRSRLYVLRLAHNRIAHLRPDDLQDNIKGLDLRNNPLREVDKETAKRLGNIEGMLNLADNLLECSCRAAPLLRALRARARAGSAATTDLTNTTCSDGTPLEAVPDLDCYVESSSSLGVWLASGLAAVLALALAVTSFLASRERRFFALAVLHRYGVAWHAADPPEDADRPYDAFLTFSHRDEEVARQVMTRLEPVYRLCVHHRDWIPGLSICSQVVRSVRESRRTLALVSNHFLASKWAYAEFREAHAASMLDARPRLLVVLLEEPAALRMDDQLRRYVDSHTYVRWGEPWFWDKLAVALPRPRAESSPPRGTPPLPALELEPMLARPTSSAT